LLLSRVHRQQKSLSILYELGILACSQEESSDVEIPLPILTRLNDEIRFRMCLERVLLKPGHH